MMLIISYCHSFSHIYYNGWVLLLYKTNSLVGELLSYHCNSYPDALQGKASNSDSHTGKYWSISSMT